MGIILTDYLPWINSIIMVFITLGGVWAFRSGYFKQAGEIQSQVIDALKENISILEKKVEECEKEITRLKQRDDITQSALKAAGLVVTIDGTIVTTAVPLPQRPKPPGTKP